MAVEVQIDCHGVTLEQYDEAMEIGGFLPGGPLPPAGLFHYVRKTEDGIRVTVVWETEAEFEVFAVERLAPLLGEIGIPGSSLTIQFFELHNYLAGSRYGRKLSTRPSLPEGHGQIRGNRTALGTRDGLTLMTVESREAVCRRDGHPQTDGQPDQVGHSVEAGSATSSKRTRPAGRQCRGSTQPAT